MTKNQVFFLKKIESLTIDLGLPYRITEPPESGDDKESGRFVVIWTPNKQSDDEGQV